MFVMMTIGNFFVRLVLRSPFHRLLSRAFLVIHLRGRKTGRSISTPVNYWETGDQFIISSKRTRTWWKNLRGGADVKVRLRGRDCAARAIVVESQKEVADGFREMFAIQPGMAKLYGVKCTPDAKPREEDLARLADQSIQIRLTLSSA
jgi:deazaflavin-dependent oxidoreductase (nitroreductase family)